MVQSVDYFLLSASCLFVVFNSKHQGRYSQACRFRVSIFPHKQVQAELSGLLFTDSGFYFDAKDGQVAWKTLRLATWK
jgi:hypothetical protein